MYAGVTRSGSRLFQAFSAMRTFCLAVSNVNGGNGGRDMVQGAFRSEMRQEWPVSEEMERTEGGKCWRDVSSVKSSDVLIG